MRLTCFILMILLITCQNSEQLESSQPKIHHLSLEKPIEDIAQPQSQATIEKILDGQQQPKLPIPQQEQKSEQNLETKANQPEPEQPNEQKNNESFIDCASRVSGVSALIGAVGGATAGIGSAAGLSAAGFTTGGVAAGSVAAGVHSAIGVVEAGSTFAYLQSLGAVGQGLLGASVLPATLAIGVIAGGGYLAYECYETLK